jgi:hypothetical protein
MAGLAEINSPRDILAVRRMRVKSVAAGSSVPLSFFAPYWRETGASPVADIGLEVITALDQSRRADVTAMLFPALPTLLGYHSTPYAQACVDVTHQMRRELGEPPDTPLPSAET